MGTLLRDYTPADFEQVKAIHEATEIDYRCPDFSAPLFLVSKVLVVDEIVRALGGMYVQCEAYLVLDKSDWGTPEQKLDAIRALDRACMSEAYLKGVDTAVLWLPPGMDRFGRRLVEDLGFERDREGWHTYSKKTQ